MMFPKPSRTDRVKVELSSRRAGKKVELDAKAAVRRRDKRCRFPLCGCKRLDLRLEVSHEKHKGMGGNPAGDRNTTENLVLLCVHRHQDGAISRGKGTLRVRFLSRHGYDGPVAWMVDLGTTTPRWTEVAREFRPGELEPLTEKQRGLLEALAELSL